MPLPLSLIGGLAGLAGGVLTQAALARRSLDHLDDEHRLKAVELTRTRSRLWSLATVAMLPVAFLDAALAVLGFAALVVLSGSASVRRYRSAGFPDDFLRLATRSYLAMATGFAGFAAAAWWHLHR